MSAPRKDTRKRASADFIVEFADHRTLGPVVPVMVDNWGGLDGLDAESIISALPEIVTEARKTAVTRAGLIVYEAYNSDSKYLDELDEAGKAFMPASVRLATAWHGRKREYLVVGRTEDGSVWNKPVKAFDEQDGRLTAAWQMALVHHNEHEGADALIRRIGLCDIEQIVHEPLPRSDVADALRAIVAQANNEGMSGPAVDKAQEILEELGMAPEPSAGPRP